jgi:hypothetical protein
MRRINLVLLPLLVCISFLTSCSNSSQEVGAAEVTAVINEEDYTRYAVNSLDAYKIACFAVLNNDWIIAAQKWTEGDALAVEDGREYALGLTQAMEARLQKGQDAEWNGELAEEVIRGACSRIASL